MPVVCDCNAEPVRCDACVRFSVSCLGGGAIARGAALAERIALTRPQVLNAPRFADLPWPAGFDLTELAIKQIDDITQDRRTLEQLAPRVLEGAERAWEASTGLIADLRSGRANARRVLAQRERDRRRYEQGR